MSTSPRRSVRNYTTEVDPVKSAGEILGILNANGARRASIDYQEGRPVGIEFEMDVELPGTGGLSRTLRYRLPVRVGEVESRMQADVDAKRIQRHEGSREQAARTAWRNTRDLVDVLFATTKLGQLEPTEALFPFLLLEGGDTAYAGFLAFEAKRALQAPRE